MSDDTKQKTDESTSKDSNDHQRFGFASSLFRSAKRIGQAILMSAPITTRSRRTPPKTAKGKKAAPGALELEQWIEQAVYEVTVDPYRGIQTLAASAASAVANDSDDDDDEQGSHNGEEEASIDLTGGPDTPQDLVGPWRNHCVFGNSTITDDQQQQEDSISEAEAIVIAASGTTCPSLVKWTENALQKSKKRKRTRPNESTLGRRPEDPTMRCACDYNPFCLCSLGGVMDDILQDCYNNNNNNSSYSNDGKHDHDDDDDGSDNDSDVMLVDKDDTDDVMVVDNNDDFRTQTTNWKDLSNPFYAKTTAARLKRVRKSQLVPETVVRTYLKSILQDMTAVLSTDDCIQRIRKMHSQLLFQNPLFDDYGEQLSSTSTDCRKLRLAVPPGIENLGATCYLNTQLQCLAQNRVFVQGVSAWRAVADDRMSSVLSLFQHLLVSMNAGYQNTVNTMDFSNALGLDHYEQQDPNEFSRLLLDKMHESFQQEQKSGRRDLAELLPHLFQGILRYETTCLTCHTKSRRTEEFMDLNLPIVRAKDGAVVTKGQRTILDAFAAKVDSDVQYCLDQYCKEELFDGDNQYWCSQCGCKRDAKREMSFKKLPPVLNIQLSRYVFDREKLLKKKLSDKVLLPLDLSVHEYEDRNCNTTAAAAANTGKGTVNYHRYLLCAVMRHKGTSAYSGHYVAEAMDWLTGQWFEFNDEKVILLEKGPSNSYDPTGMNNTTEQTTSKTNTNGGNATKRRKGVGSVAGSQDAYNMYFVEEGFLAQSVLDVLRKRPDDETVGVDDKIAIQRSEFYADLTQMCLEDGEANKRLERRRDIIRTQMFPDPLHCQISSPDDLVWVDATMLRRFISCRDRLEDVLVPKDNRSVLQHHELLCRHENPGLHPRVARKGKLLPKIAYEAYITALREEQHALTLKHSDESEFNDCVIIPTHGLICKQCSEDYRSELMEKFKKVKTLKYLYDTLDPKEKQFSLEVGLNETIGNECDRYAYRVSRKFVTWFRNEFARLMKTTASAAAEAKSADYSAEFVELSAENMAEGVDGLDLSPFEMNGSRNGKDDVDEGISVRVNGPITCPHGNFKPQNALSVRTVNWSVWREIKRQFPLAIEHKKKRIHTSLSLDFDSDSDDDDFGCPECQAAGIAENDLKTNLEALAQFCKGSRSCEALTNEDVIEQSMRDGTTQYRILHQDDLEAWRKFLAAFKRKDGKGGKLSLADIAKEALLPNTSWSTPRNLLSNGTQEEASDSDRKRLELLSGVFRPIICSKHGQPTFSSLFQPCTDGDEATPLSLSGHVCVIDEDTYKDFVAHMVAVSVMLFPSDEQASNGLSVHAYISEAAVFCQKWKIDSYHPSFTISRAGHVIGADKKFSISSDKMAMFFELEMELCRDEECGRCYSDWHAAETVSKVPSLTASKTAKRQSGGAADDPIAVDSDLEWEDTAQSATCSLKVFDVQSGANVDSALSSLQTCSGSQLSSVEGELDGQFLRRSSRKRKTRYPVGVIDEEDTIQANFTNNVAALRLLLLERCTNGKAFELDHSLTLVLSVPVKSSGPIVVDVDDTADGDAGASSEQRVVKLVDLSFDRSSEVLCELCENALGQKLDPSFSPSDCVMLLRQANEDSTVAAFPKDALMDHLIGLANTTSDVATTSDSASNGKNNKKKKKPRTERGFTGTFLSSAPNRNTREEDGAHLQDVDNVDILDCTSQSDSRRSSKIPSAALQATANVVDESGDSEGRKKVLTPSNRSEFPSAAQVDASCENPVVHTADDGGRDMDKSPEPDTSILLSGSIAEDEKHVCQPKASESFRQPEKRSLVRSICAQSRGGASSTHKKSALEMLNDSSDDEKVLKSPFESKKPSSKQPPDQTTVDKASVAAGRGRRPRRENISDPSHLKALVLSMLLQNPDIETKDENMCEMAAETALQLHPEQNDPDMLINVAYTKYLEFTMSS